MANDHETDAEHVPSKYTTFSLLGIDRWLIESLNALSIRTPTPIQAACIPAILAGRDCVGGAKTGSGKTCAFALPILQTWSHDPYGIYALILTPTRELALQIADQFSALGSSLSLKLVTVLGGTSILEQSLALSRRPHVVIATPGRLADHVRSNQSNDNVIVGFRRCKFLVLDEADRLLEDGFAEDLETCLNVLPSAVEGRQTLLFSATITDGMRKMKNESVKPGRKPLFLHEANTASMAVPTSLKQNYLLLPNSIKLATLHLLLCTPPFSESPLILFVNRTYTAALLYRMLRLLGHRCTSMSSSLPQHERTNSLHRFRAGAARILVATDLASRGLDIPSVAWVIHYDLPAQVEDYIHRCGRTARIGRKGGSLCIVTERDIERLKGIETRIGSTIQKGEEIKESKVIEVMKEVGEAKRRARMAMEEEGWGEKRAMRETRKKRKFEEE